MESTIGPSDAPSAAPSDTPSVFGLQPIATLSHTGIFFLCLPRKWKATHLDTSATFLELSDTLIKNVDVVQHMLDFELEECSIL